MNLCIDLCSGLGGFSRAFVDAGWEVVTVDNNPKFKPTICADLLTLKASDIEAVTKLGSFKAYDILALVASPPCEKFSQAAIGRGAKWPRKGLRKALEIVGAVMELIAEIEPEYWMIENPKARLRWFLGKPSITVSYQDYGSDRYKLTDLWSNFYLPLLTVKISKKRMDWEKKIIGYRDMSHDKQNLLRHRIWAKETKSSPLRAIIPPNLSQAVLEAVENKD